MRIDQAVFDEIASRLPAGYMGPETTADVHAFLYSLVRLVQPDIVLEIGTYSGDATAHLVLAVAENGHGHVTGYESSPRNMGWTKDRLAAAFPEGGPYTVSDEFEYGEAFSLVPCDFVFLDLDPKTAYQAVLDQLDVSHGGYVVAHDLTFPPEAEVVSGFANELVWRGYEVLRIQQGRGLVVARNP